MFTPMFTQDAQPAAHHFCKCLILLAVPARLELATFGLGNRCSIRLSYGTRNFYSTAWLHAGSLGSLAILQTRCRQHLRHLRPLSKGIGLHPIPTVTLARR